MKYITTHAGAIGAMVVTTGILAIGGVAAACPTHGSTATTSWSGNQSNRQSVSGWSNTSYRMNSNWNEWNPATYSRNTGGSFNNWWNGMMNQASSYSGQWSAGSTNTSWMPSGNNWQQSWSNWNPMTWESNGSSYSNWHTQFMNYMNSQKSTFQSDFNS